MYAVIYLFNAVQDPKSSTFSQFNLLLSLLAIILSNIFGNVLYLSACKAK